MGRTKTVLVSSLALLLLVSVVTASYSAITVYTSQASFHATAPPGTAVVANFETQPTGPRLPFTEGGLAFNSLTLGNLYIIGPTDPGATNPLPSTKMLTAAGLEDIQVVASPGWTYALGFTLLTALHGPATATLFDENGAVLATYQPTQAPNTVGFVGFVGTGPSRIAKLRWTSVSASNQTNTALDNIHTEFLAITPVNPTSWGRIKALYRQ